MRARGGQRGRGPGGTIATGRRAVPRTRAGERQRPRPGYRYGYRYRGGYGYYRSRPGYGRHRHVYFPGYRYPRAYGNYFYFPGFYFGSGYQSGLHVGVGSVYSGYGYPYGWYDPYAGYGYGYGYGHVADAYTGFLRLKVRPRDAEVYVNGYFVGIVNDFDGIFQRLRLEEGTHTVELRHPGYQPLPLDVLIVPGEKVTFEGDMLPLP